MEIQEIWKDIEGYEGYYQVSNHGRIKSLARSCISTNGYVRDIHEMIKKVRTVANGYMQTNLSRDGKCIHLLVHRLVAQAFVPNPKNKLQVNHIDGVKDNNLVTNLEWCTPSENTLHAVRAGLKKSQKGCKRTYRMQKPCMRKPVNQLAMDGTFIRIWSGGQIAAIELGLNATRIYDCVNGKRSAKSHGGYKWERADDVVM